MTLLTLSHDFYLKKNTNDRLSAFVSFQPEFEIDTFQQKMFDYLTVFIENYNLAVKMLSHLPFFSNILRDLCHFKFTFINFR